jgi:hypothetical protein
LVSGWVVGRGSLAVGSCAAPGGSRPQRVGGCAGLTWIKAAPAASCQGAAFRTTCGRRTRRNGACARSFDGSRRWRLLFRRPGLPLLAEGLPEPQRPPRHRKRPRRPGTRARAPVVARKRRTCRWRALVAVRTRARAAARGKGRAAAVRAAASELPHAAGHPFGRWAASPCREAGCPQACGAEVTRTTQRCRSRASGDAVLRSRPGTTRQVAAGLGTTGRVFDSDVGRPTWSSPGRGTLVHVGLVGNTARVSETRGG